MQPYSDPRISTGCTGLDEVLRGGITPKRLYLLEGHPGSGKTTLALQFLLAGVAAGERVLYITLSESKEELLAAAASHGWSLDGIDLFELASAAEVLGEGREQSLLHPYESELAEIVELIEERVERSNPVRVAFDSLSELRLLAQDPLRYRRQVLSLKQYFARRNATILLVDDLTTTLGQTDGQLRSICHGVIALTQQTLEFGSTRRRVEIVKMRGVDFRTGSHDLTLRHGGIAVYPRLIAAEYRTPFVGEAVRSGVVQLDALLGGGPLRGMSMLVSGPAGSGKTSIALQYVDHACKVGERCTIYEFDERVGTMYQRARAMGLALEEDDCLRIRQVDPAELSPGEFTSLVRHEVEERKVTIIVLDSLVGFLASMPQEPALILQLHELLSYLNEKGVMTIIVNPRDELLASINSRGLNISYIADVVLMVRFFEDSGRVRKAISVVKNRAGQHEDSIRELRIDSHGIRIGEPLANFRGVLSGTPEYVGARAPLMESLDDEA